MSTSLTYLRPNTIEEAATMLGDPNMYTMAIAGGSSLAFDSDIQADTLVDLGQLGLDKIKRVDERLYIGATTTLQMIVEAGQSAAPHDPRYLLGLAAHDMAAMGLRNRVTLGGALVNADSASPIVTALLACNADVLLFVPNANANAKDKYKTVSLSAFLDYRPQLLKAGNLILSAVITMPGEDSIARYEKVARTPADYPIVCVASRYEIHKGMLENVQIAVGGVAATPIYLGDLCFALEKKPLDFLDAALIPAVAALNPPSNWLGSSDYRREMAKVLIGRTITNYKLQITN